MGLVGERMCALKRSSVRWLSVIAFISAAGISTSSRCAAQAFVSGARFDFPAGPAPYGVAVGDVNGDGRPDLAAANWGASTVSVLLGDGHDGFGAPTSFATGGAPYSVAMGDLNGDGKTDLVVVNDISNSVSILLGNGSGGFATRTDYSTGSTPYAVAIGDVSGDGKVDLAVANSGANTITVLRGTGLGSFGSRADFQTGARPVSVGIGDLNGDGAPDLVSANSNGSSVSVLIGNGAGGFAAKADFATAVGPRGLAIGDLNGDGRLDVATANSGGASATFLLGDGLGGLGSRTDFSTGGSPSSIVVGDLNGDGKTDAAVASSSTNLISVLQGNGTGTFSSKLDFATPLQPQGIAIADINGDGKPDLLSANAGAGSVSVLLANNPVGLYQWTSLTPPGLVSGVALADFTADGRLDLAISNGNTLSLYVGNGPKGFGSHTDIDSYGTATIVTGDLNGDGKLDVLAVNQPFNAVTCYFGNGLGALTPSGTFTTGTGPVAAALGDLNGDGKLDVVVANQSANTISVLLGNGLGGFGAKTDFGAGSAPASVALGDLNGDGKLDAAVANSGSNTVTYFLGTGSGELGARPDLDAAFGPTSIAIGDLNRDGALDLAVANSGSASLSVWLGTGNVFAAPFGARNDIPAVGSLSSIAIADLNGDGRLDLVVTSPPGDVATMLGDGSGGFSGTPVVYGLGGFAHAVATGDVNGDGKLDLAVACLHNRVPVLLASVAAGITLTSDPSPPTSGSTFTLTASLSVPPFATGVPSGTVSFFDGTTAVGSSAVSRSSASLSTSSLSLVGHVFSAVYGGDTRFPPAISRGLAVPTTLAPHIARIRDVPNDQGGQVTIEWDASAFDRAPNGPISAYWIWRQVPSGAALARVARGATLMRAGESRGRPVPGAILATIDGAETFYWEYVKSQVAHGFPGYSDLATTTADSTTASNPRTRFMVEAEQLSTGLYWSSAPDSGYSVDNLPPSVPAPFTAAYSGGTTHLHWGAGSDVDLLSFRLYRGVAAGFVPDVSNQIATTSDTGYADSGPAGRYYELSAVDIHGNESIYATLGPNETVDAPVTTLYLAPPSPNPASRGAMFRFGLPREGPVTLALFDQQGRRVRALAKGVLPAGQHRLDWDGCDDAGRVVASGIYFARLEHEGQSLVARLIAIR